MDGSLSDSIDKMYEKDSESLVWHMNRITPVHNNATQCNLILTNRLLIDEQGIFQKS